MDDAGADGGDDFDFSSYIAQNKDATDGGDGGGLFD